MLGLPAVSAKKNRGIDFIFLDLNTKVQTHHCNQLIFRGASSVIDRSIENVQLMIEQAREINRWLAKNRRQPNHYQVLNAHNHHKSNI
jgi:hypothetical protein